MFEYITLPTYLTLIRLCAAPLVLPFFFVLLLPYNSFVINMLLMILFGLFSFTDFLDGFLARYYRQESLLGTLLDPIADKFLIFSSLIALLVVKKIFFLWVLIFIGRDLFMMGLRQIGAEHSINVSVSFWGKARTCALIFYIAFLILNPYAFVPWSQAPWWHSLEFILLLAALGLTIWSAKLYTQAFLTHYMAKINSTHP